MAGARVTRLSISNSLVKAGELPTSDLPTLKDVLGKMLLERDNIVESTKVPNVAVKAFAEVIIPDIKTVYKKVNSNLVVNSDRTILGKLTKEYKLMKELERSGKKTEGFVVKLGKLFDIINCKCQILTCEDFKTCEGCDNKVHILCECEDDEKIPEVELLYVFDQRSRRDGLKGKFQISGRDEKEIDNMVEVEEEKLVMLQNEKKKQDAINKAKEKEKERLESEKILTNTELSRALDDIDPENNLLEADDSEIEHSGDKDFNLSSTVPRQNRQDLRNLSMICDRYGVSSRAGAAIANAALADAGVISAADQTNVIDKNKLRRAIDRYREERKDADHESLVQAQGEAYYFDGKKDSTLFVGKDEKGKQYNYYAEEEHISMSSEPGGRYVSHLTPTGGTGAEIAEAVVGYLTEQGVVDSWKIIGGDSTAVNTAVDKGCFVLIENSIGRRLFRVVCCLHLNELPWRHVFVDIDGPTDSKNTFKGVIGKLLPKVEDLEWNQRFKKVDDGPGLPPISDEVAADLSSDQKILHLAVDSVRSGKIRVELYSLTPGPISHSRWLTHATRNLLLYMKKHGLTGKNRTNLNKFVQFIMTNYAVMWFNLKQKDSIVEAPRHLFSQIELTRLLPKDIQAIARKNIARNAYWAHPECLILSMLTDTDEKVREMAVDKIMAIRGESESGDNYTRKFIIPNLQFQAAKYTEMIDWAAETVHEPTLTTSLSSAELSSIKSSPLALPKYPGNTQSVERLVKQTTRAADTVAGYSARDGFLRASAKSREMMPRFESKQDYQNNFL